jgi:transcriptional regulator with XRE-family HTH domain
MEETVYQRIRRLRTDKGMTQLDLAKKVGYSGKDMVSRVESGKVDISRNRLIQFADALGVSPLYLFNGSESIEEIGQPLPPISEDDKLLDQFHRLDDEDRARVKERIEMLLESDKYKKDTGDKAM